MNATRTTLERRRFDPFARIAVLTVIYTVVAWFGLQLDAVSRFAALVWAPTGLSLAAVLLVGDSAAVAVLLGAFAANVWTGAPVSAAVAIATGNTLEALLGALAMRRIAGSRGPLESLRQVLALIVPAALLSTLVSATIGTTSIALHDIIPEHHYWETWRAWWVGDVLGDMIVAPFVLTYASPQAPYWKNSKNEPERILEAGLLLALLVVASRVVFFRPPGSILYPFESPYVLFPLFIWAAVRFKLHGATLSTLIASAVAIWGTVHGTGPFARQPAAEGLFSLQTFMGCAALTPLVVAGAMVDRARLERIFATEASRREARLRILSLASRDFVETNLDVSGLFEVLARHLAKAIGDACAVHLLTEDGKHSRLVALHHEDPGVRASLAERLEKNIRDASEVELPLLEVVETERSLVLPEAPPPLTRAGIHGLLSVPLRSRGALIGCITLVRTSPSRPYTAEDRSLLEELSDRAGLAMHNARLHEDLQAAVQVRDDFLAIAGHELKTPLSAMLMQLQSVERAVRNDPTVLADRLAKAAKSGLRLERLINQLLDVSRITGGKLRLETEEFSLSDLVRDVVIRFTEGGLRPGAVISVHCDEPANGRWDRLRLDQVVDNLLGNAVKYGQGKPIEVDLRVRNGEATLRIADHGIGIQPDHQKRIFQRFERAVATRDFGGLGLGLWISRQIVEASGGSIQVESAVGEGSTFMVRLPLDRRAPLPEEQHAGN